MGVRSPGAGVAGGCPLEAQQVPSTTELSGAALDRFLSFEDQLQVASLTPGFLGVFQFLECICIRIETR